MMNEDIMNLIFDYLNIISHYEPTKGLCLVSKLFYQKHKERISELFNIPGCNTLYSYKDYGQLARPIRIYWRDERIDQPFGQYGVSAIFDYRNEIDEDIMLLFLLAIRREGYEYVYLLGGDSCGISYCRHHFDDIEKIGCCLEQDCDELYKIPYFRYSKEYEKYGISCDYNGENCFVLRD